MNQVQEPQFEGEEMKMPANASLAPTEELESTIEPSPVTGPVLIILTIILIALLGGLGYWYYLVSSMPVVEPVTPERPTADMNQEPETPTAQARTEALDVVSTSDELDAIEADVFSTNLDELDLEMNAIDAELEAAMEAEF